MVTWLVTEKNSTEEKRYKELLSINLPKEFTAYDGAAIIFCFDNNGRAWVAYEYYYGSSDEDAKNSYMRRISRKRKTVLGDGTNFNINDYSKYKQSNPRGTLEDFLRMQDATDAIY